MMIPRMSIVTASYDQLDFLKLAARSIADQAGGFEVEHIVQEGKGGDEFKRWADDQDFSVCFCEDDSGMYDAINRGFDRCSGDIIAWLNCDEQYLPGTLQRVVEWFEQNPDSDILVADVILIDSKGEPLAYRSAMKPWKGHIRSCFLPTYSAATFVRRRVFEEGHRLDTNFRMIADAVWVMGFLREDYPIGVLNEPLAVFTQTGENLGQSKAGDEELNRWRRSGTRFPEIRRFFWQAAHRMRKLAMGGYKQHKVEYRIFVNEGEDRKQFRGKVGEKWPTIDS